MDKLIIIKKYFSSNLLALAIICFLVAFGSFLFANKSVKTHSQTVQEEKPKTISVTPTKEPIQSKIIKDEGKKTPVTPTLSPIKERDLAVSTPTPAPTATPQNLKATLIINGSSVGLIDVSSGANQCDVLNNALSQGKIQSLNMRYNSDLGTYGVYQINGIGKENVIWWAYKVNGQSPNQGCSYVKVNNGDSSEWIYLGS